MEQFSDIDTLWENFRFFSIDSYSLKGSSKDFFKQIMRRIEKPILPIFTIFGLCLVLRMTPSYDLKPSHLPFFGPLVLCTALLHAPHYWTEIADLKALYFFLLD